MAGSVIPASILLVLNGPEWHQASGIILALEISAIYMLVIRPKLFDPHKGKYGKVLQAWCIERFAALVTKPPTLEFSAQEVEAIRQNKTLNSLAAKYVGLLASIEKSGQAQIWGYDPDECAKQLKLMSGYYHKDDLLELFADSVEELAHENGQNGVHVPNNA